MWTRRWVIIGTGAVAVAALITAAVLFGLQGVEVVSWIAGVTSLVVAVAVMAVTWPSPPRPEPDRPAGGQEAASRSVTVAGDADGIISTGDGTTNIQHR